MTFIMGSTVPSCEPIVAIVDRQVFRCTGLGDSGEYTDPMPEGVPPNSAPPAAMAASLPRSPREWLEILYHELRQRARGELSRHQALTLAVTATDFSRRCPVCAVDLDLTG
jgi:hypothetical protein